MENEVIEGDKHEKEGELSNFIKVNKLRKQPGPSLPHYKSLTDELPCRRRDFKIRHSRDL